MRLALHFTTDTMDVECPEDEDLCGFAGEIEITRDAHWIEGECPQCGTEIRIENTRD
jgi:hypothetical protein